MSITLEKVKAAFDHWRANRVKRTRIPDYLIAQSLPLVNKYTKSEITRTLGINHDTFNQWLQSKAPSIDFMPLSPIKIKSAPLSPESRIELRIDDLPDLSLTVTASPAQCAELINALQQWRSL